MISIVQIIQLCNISVNLVFAFFSLSAPPESILFPTLFENLFSLFSLYLCEAFFHHTYAGVISQVNDVSIFLEISTTFRQKHMQMLSPRFLPGFALLKNIVQEEGLLNKEWRKVFSVREILIHGQMVKRWIVLQQQKRCFHYTHKQVWKINSSTFRVLETVCRD